MNIHSDSWRAQAARPIAAIALDGRLARAVVATLVIGGYMAFGFAFRLGAEAYLLLGIPITIAFQILVVRRPLRSLWLREAPPMEFTPRSIVAIVVMAIAPAVVAATGVRNGELALVGWGLAGMVGAVGAVYALRSMDRDAVRSTIRTTLITGAVLVGIMVAYRLATGGFHGNLAAAVKTIAISLATYLPVAFVVEEVLFRGILDPYLHGSTPGPDRTSALYGSALWGLWHLPVAFLALGVLTIPYLVVVHTTIGYFMVTAWRRTGNLGAPGASHAIIDAFRNAVAVF
jgi:membrane protease YdiL (CAAX protease family)